MAQCLQAVLELLLKNSPWWKRQPVRADPLGPQLCSLFWLQWEQLQSCRLVRPLISPLDSGEVSYKGCLIGRFNAIGRPFAPAFCISGSASCIVKSVGERLGRSVSMVRVFLLQV